MTGEEAARGATGGRRWVAPSLAALATLLVVIAWTWPLALGLDRTVLDSSFAAGHAWGMEHLREALRGGGNLWETFASGYPRPRAIRYIGWAPAVASLPLRAVFDPIATFHLVLLVSLPASAVGAHLLLRHWTEASRAVCAGAAVLYATAPYYAGIVAIGEVPKLQGWTLPIFLLALDHALLGRRAAWPVVALVTLATCFTAPYYGLALPLLAGGLVLARVRDRRAALRALAALALVALAMLPAAPYYDVPLPKDDVFYQPGRRPPSVDHLYAMASMTSVDRLFVALPDDGNPFSTRSVGILGIAAPLGLLGLGLAGRRSSARGRRAGLALVAGGILLALGPRLAFGSVVTSVPMPLALLDAVGYPLKHAHGLYRYIAIAALGLAVLAAAEAGRRRRGAWIVAGLVLLQLGEVFVQLGPRVGLARPLHTRDLWAGLAGEDGAVLHLPLHDAEHERIEHLWASLLHGRPITSMLQTAPDAFDPQWFHIVAEEEDAATRLRELGIRYVVVSPGRRVNVGALGEPDRVQFGYQLWDLGPTELAPLPRRF